MKSENDDGDDAASSSRYSSFGDSEFERYCSANSAMGTPSVCSSIAVFNDFPEFEIGSSSRNLGLGFGDDVGGLENFSLGGEKMEKSRDETKRLSDDCSTSVNYGSSGFELYGNESDEIGLSVLDNGLMSWKMAENESRPLKGVSEFDNGDCSEDDDHDHDGENDDDDHDHDGDNDDDDDEDVGVFGKSSNFDQISDRGVENLGLSDVASSRDEHSEGEDSMHNYGSDGQDKRVDYRSTGRSVEVKTEDENPLLINSSVAFGSDDWGDFVQESGEFAVPLNMAVLGLINKSETTNGFRDLGVTPELEEDVKDIPVASCQVQSGNEVTEFTKSSFTTPVIEEDKSQIPCIKKNHVQGFQVKIDFDDMNKRDGADETLDDEDSRVSETRAIGDFVEDSSVDQVSSCSTVSSRSTKLNSLEDSRQNPKPSTLENETKKNNFVSDDLGDKHPVPVKTEALEPNEFYDEIVLEMEEILLASNESPRSSRFSRTNRASQPHRHLLSLPTRDGGSSASTSTSTSGGGPPRIERAEVVGARQKQGDVSLGERLVGVREHTMYKIRVWGGSGDQWEVERRYRDFSTLHRRLKSLSAAQGWDLPAPWAAAERESRKIFGTVSPEVVSERSAVIQRCLDSVLGPSTPCPDPLLWFLSPNGSAPSSPSAHGTETVPHLELGRTVSLIVEIQPLKSERQVLEAQHRACAGCRRHFDDGKTPLRDLALTFGWGKPRLCEYTGQLFCSSCHANEVAVLPARVLHNWDFALYPVSQLAKSYLDSIHDQPMLCVSAVNPFLFSKVPALSHVMGVRRKIGSMLAYVRCSFRGSINRGLGSRRYLLQANDFFALRDLIDLSKGAFAVLPAMVEAVLKAIVDHITEQCLVCCDVGVPCGARQACNDPSALIFPFQEGDFEKCRSCGSEFHKACFGKLTDCHCGAHLRVGNNTGLVKKRLNGGVGGESSGALEFLGKGLGSGSGSGSGSGAGFLAGLFTKGRSKSVEEHNIDSDNVILMGSLPSNTL